MAAIRAIICFIREGLCGRLLDNICVSTNTIPHARSARQVFNSRQDNLCSSTYTEGLLVSHDYEGARCVRADVRGEGDVGAKGASAGGLRGAAHACPAVLARCCKYLNVIEKRIREVPACLPLHCVGFISPA
jgi:hypothetical protein